MIPTWCTLVVFFRAKSFKTRSQLAVKDPVPMEGVWDAVNRRSVCRNHSEVILICSYFFSCQMQGPEKIPSFPGEVVSLNRWCWKHSSHRSRLDGSGPRPPLARQGVTEKSPMWFRKGTSYSPLVGGNSKNFGIITPLFGEDSYFDEHFSKELKAPTRPTW